MEKTIVKKCAALYSHTNIRSGNRVFPCCRFKKPIQTFDGDVSNVLFSKEYGELRNKFEKEELPECNKCWHEESLGKESLRQWFNKNYSSDKTELKYLEIGFDNICNLTCDGCWEEWSSSWWAKKNPDLPLKKGIVSIDEITSVPSTIERIVFLGGEPLMTSRHRLFLEKLENLQNITVEYFTNGMFSLTNKDQKVLNQCKSVKFTVSIDGYGELNNRIRSGSDWQTVEKNTKQISSLYNSVVHTVVHKNSWHGLTDLARWIEDNSYSWTTNVLTYPSHLDIINLESKEKQKLKHICKTTKIPNSDYIISHLNNIIVKV
jgi:sulfatase maturation enzyme AslB (radical SAM superfamily)